MKETPKMQNPGVDGCVIIETIGKNKEGKHESRCYPGPVKRSREFKVDAGIFKNGFNPKKLSLHGERILIYAKNMTLEFDDQGNVTTWPVNTFKGDLV